MSDQIVEIPFIDNDMLPIIFTDIIEISVNNETAQLRIGTKNNKTNDATGTHRIIMTTPHFLRLAEKIQEVSNDIIKQLEIKTK